jgi:hypothetical protein
MEFFDRTERCPTIAAQRSARAIRHRESAASTAPPSPHTHIRQRVALKSPPLHCALPPSTVLRAVSSLRWRFPDIAVWTPAALRLRLLTRIASAPGPLCPLLHQNQMGRIFAQNPSRFGWFTTNPTMILSPTPDSRQQFFRPPQIIRLVAEILGRVSSADLCPSGSSAQCRSLGVCRPIRHRPDATLEDQR